MATRYIKSTTSSIPAPPGSAASIQHDIATGVIQHRVGSTTKYLVDTNSSQTITGKAKDVVAITGATTLVAADSGKFYVFNSTGNITVTLPATSEGLVYDFFVGVAAGGGNLHQVDPNASDFIRGNGFSETTPDGKAAQNTQATAAVGDHITLVGDGDIGWLIFNVRGTWARET